MNKEKYNDYNILYTNAVKQDNFYRCAVIYPNNVIRYSIP